MIADTNSSITRNIPATILEEGRLSAAELYQLTLYKWRYSLEAYGFEAAEVRELMFVKWLYASHRVQG